MNRLRKGMSYYFKETALRIAVVTGTFPALGERIPAIDRLVVRHEIS